MSEYNKRTIRNVINGINKEYFLPDIQRSFVWKPLQIYKLFDSIMRPYPISTFLFWELDKEFVKREDVKLLSFVKSNKEESELLLNYERDKYYLVLDGQQRLTSFYMALKGTYWERNREKEVYFNTLSGVELNEEGLLYEFKLFPGDRGDYFIEVDKEKKKIRKLWINVKRIYELPSGKAEDIRTFVHQAIDGISNKIGLLKYMNSPNVENLVFDKVHDFYYHLTADPVINYYPEKRQDYDAALDIFVRTNMGGTKLSYSDLLFSNIKRRWDKAREKFRELLEQINMGTFNFDGDFILKTCLVIFSEKQKDVRYRIENVKEKKIETIKQNWDKIARAIKLTLSIVKNYAGLTTDKLLTSHNALIPGIYFIYKNEIRAIADHGNDVISDLEIKKITSWLHRVLLTGVFGGQSDNILYKTKEVLEKASKSFPDLALNRQIRSIGKSLDVNKDFLNEIKYNSIDSYLLLFLLYRNQNLKLDFNPSYKGETPQQDHIFSQDELGDFGYSERARARARRQVKTSYL